MKKKWGDHPLDKIIAIFNNHVILPKGIMIYRPAGAEGGERLETCTESRRGWGKGPMDDGLGSMVLIFGHFVFVV